ncbi:hypothetical protein F4827_006344 [Paraburkholderia bannensis]|uniref:Uncharacterized protein n=1 Tax=Paraburkholderia bannensis TaxID=765414 RepID=A0A7W9WW56_9BURK|nr:hypothetical protein [Paraburkholderia bannensis]MBB3262366.1 hypothetical protein [Paraburkholderia sp. WP4_3_2]MBB6106469.1 hypothetical protein [Paraburkholderia bannensis]
MLKLLADPAKGFNQEPPEGAVFLHDDEVAKCSSILHQMIGRSMQAPVRPGNRRALPLPDIDLPLMF